MTPSNLLVTTLAIGLTAVFSACGTTTTSPPRPTATAKATVKATPTAPDVQRIDLGATGVGVYQLVTVPVVLIHNASTQHAALGLVAHFTPSRADNHPLDRLDSPPINLAPGESLAVAANCTDTCGGATHTDVTVSVASWGDVAKAPLISGGAGAYARGGGGGAGFGEVSGSLSAATVPTGAAFSSIAVCYDAAGAIVGGGTNQSVWSVAGSAQPTSVSVIVSVQPSRCEVYGAVGG